MRGRVLILIGAIILLVVVVVVVLMTRSGDEKSDADATATEDVVVIPDSSTGDQPSTSGEPITPPTGGDTTEVVEIVVAVQTLTRGMVIPESGVSKQAWPLWALAEPEQYFTEIDEVVGKIARTDIYIGSPVNRRFVVDNLYQVARTGSDAAAMLAGLPENALGTEYVAIAVPLDPSGVGQVAYAVQDGDYVDVVLSFLFIDVDQTFQTRMPNNISVITRLETGELSIGTPRTGRTEASALSPEGVLVGPSETSQRPRLMTVRTVTNAFVVHVGHFPPGGNIVGATPTPLVVAPPPAPPGETDTAQAAPTELPTATPYRPLIITLGVSPQDALVLTWAIDAQIPITLLLREAGDPPITDTVPVTLEYMLNRYTLDENGNPQVPRSLPYALEPPITSVRRFDLQSLYNFLGPGTGEEMLQESLGPD